MSKEFPGDHAAKLLEVHDQPGEIFCFFKSDEFKFKVDPDIRSIEFIPESDSATKGAVATRYSRRIYGIGDSPE